MQILLLLLTILGGMGLSVEAGLLGPLGKEVGELWATFSIFGVGAALTFLLMLFFSPRNSPNETKPKNIPDSGPIYREYIQDNLKRFLRSLPACPNCHQQTYDLFVHTTTLTRFEDGSSYPKYPEEYYGVDEERSAKVKDKAVWWYGDEAEAKRLNLNFL